MPATVRFLPFGTTVTLDEGESIFEGGKRAGVPIPTACGGQGTCGLCRIRIVAGEADLPPLSPVEKRHLGNTYFITRLRLACRVRPTSGAVEVLLPDAARSAPRR